MTHGEEGIFSDESALKVGQGYVAVVVRAKRQIRKCGLPGSPIFHVVHSGWKAMSLIASVGARVKVFPVEPGRP